MQNKNLLLTGGIVALMLLLVPSLSAQTATITGRVTDATEAVIPATQITVISEATSASRTVRTNEVGYYTVPLLPPGRYRIEVRQDGFKPINRTGIILEVDQNAEINFVMELGEVTEQIEVTADTVQLNTVEASRGQVIENQRIVEMPLNGRNYNQLALLSAGAVQPVGGRFGGFSVAGQRTTQNNFILDGVDNNGVELAGAQRRSEMVQPSIDAIQEFKVQTNSYAAEYGRATGGVVNVTTKSGTNQIHGTAFEFLRNEKLDAKNFFDPPGPKPPFKRNQYGLSLGGPLYIPKVFDGRNKIFWFGDFEKTKIRESRTATSTIPTMAMRTGDFSEVLAERNRVINDPLTGNPFPGNIIPQGRIDPVSQTLINLYPTPQNSDVAANFVYQSPRTEDVNKWDFRADVNAGSLDNMYWRISVHDFDRPQALTLPAPAFGGGNDQLVQGINTGAGWNHIWSPNLIMAIRASWGFALFKRDNVAAAKQLAQELGVVNLNDAYGIPGAAPGASLGSQSIMSISGYTNVGQGGFNPVDRDSQNRQLKGDLTWTHGKHTVKFGGNILRSQNNIFNIRHEVGTWTYNAKFTGDGMADMLLGWSSQYRFQSRIQVQLRQWLWGGYVQDDWKITPRLTLNLGLRYELVQPWVDLYDRIGIFDITTDPDNPQLIFGGQGPKRTYHRAMYNLDTNNFMPRLGLAYKVNDKTVVRAGWGRFFVYMEPYGDAQYLIGNPPNAYGVDIASSQTEPAVILSEGPSEGATELRNATGLTFSSYQRDPKLGSSMQWNFNIQREFGRDWLFEIGYSGSRGAHLLRRYDGNFSPPGPGNINAKRRYQSATVPLDPPFSVSPLGNVIYYVQDGNSFYHGLVTKLEKRFSRGFTTLVSYTWSKNIGDVCGNAASGNTSGCGFQDLRNINGLERSVDNQDVPHRFVVSTIWDLPFGRGRQFGSNMGRALDAVIGGWSVGSIVTLASGRPYSVTIAGNPANTGSHGVVNRPDVNGDPYGIDRTVAQDFNPDVFSRQEDFQIGTLGRNTMRQRGFFNWDFSLLKNFQIYERMRLQFRFESFHFTNTPRFGQAGNAFGTNNFGRITSAGTPRNLQFGLKLIW